MKMILHYCIAMVLMIFMGAMLGCTPDFEETMTPAEKELNDAEESIMIDHRVVDENESKAMDQYMEMGRQASESKNITIEDTKKSEDMFNEMQKRHEKERKEVDEKYPLDGKKKNK